MVRILLIGLLALSMACLLPMMGVGHTASGHLHHGMSASCATCIGPGSLMAGFIFLTLMGMATIMILSALVPVPIRDKFHPPRSR